MANDNGKTLEILKTLVEDLQSRGALHEMQPRSRMALALDPRVTLFRLQGFTGATVAVGKAISVTSKKITADDWEQNSPRSTENSRLPSDTSWRACTTAYTPLLNEDMETGSLRKLP